MLLIVSFLQILKCSSILRGKPLPESVPTHITVHKGFSGQQQLRTYLFMFFFFRMDFWGFALFSHPISLSQSLSPNEILKAVTGHYGGLACIQQGTVFSFNFYLFFNQRGTEPKDEQSLSRYGSHFDNTPPKKRR